MSKQFSNDFILLFVFRIGHQKRIMLAIRKIQNLARAGHGASNPGQDSLSHYSNQSSLQSSAKLTCSQSSLQSSGSVCTNSSSNTGGSLYLPLQPFIPACPAAPATVQQVTINTRRPSNKQSNSSPDGAQPPLGHTPTTPELKTFQQLPNNGQSHPANQLPPISHSQLEPIYVSKQQLLQGSTSPISATGHVLYTASGQPVYAPAVQPLYHHAQQIYASQPIYATNTQSQQKLVQQMQQQPIYSNGSEMFVYELDSAATLGRPKSLVKNRPVAKIVAKTREELNQQMIESTPDKQSVYTGDLMNKSLDQVTANNYINHLHQQTPSLQHQQMIYEQNGVVYQKPPAYPAPLQPQYHHQQQMSHSSAQPIYAQQFSQEQQMIHQHQLHLQLQQMHLPLEQLQHQQLGNSFIYATLKRKKLPPPIPKRTNSMRSGCNTAPTTPLLPPTSSPGHTILQRRGSLDDCSQLNGLLPLSLPPPTNDSMQNERDFMQEQAFATCVKSLTTRFSLNAKALEKAHEANVVASAPATITSVFTISRATAATSESKTTHIPSTSDEICKSTASDAKNGSSTVQSKSASNIFARQSPNINDNLSTPTMTFTNSTVMDSGASLRTTVSNSATQLQRISTGSSNCSSSLSTLCSSSGVSSIGSAASSCETGSCSSSLNGQSRTPSATSSECIVSQTNGASVSSDAAEDFPPPPSPSVLPTDMGSSGPSSLENLPPPPPPPPHIISHSSTQFHKPLPPPPPSTSNQHVAATVMPIVKGQSGCCHGDCSISSSSSTDSMPFANENIGTLKPRSSNCPSGLCLQRQMMMFANGSESSDSLTASISSASSSTRSGSSSAAQTPHSPAKHVVWPCSPVKELLSIEMVPSVNQSNSEADTPNLTALQPKMSSVSSKPIIPARTSSVGVEDTQRFPIDVNKLQMCNTPTQPNINFSQPQLKSIPLITSFPQVPSKPRHSVPYTQNSDSNQATSSIHKE